MSIAVVGRGVVADRVRRLVAPDRHAELDEGATVVVLATGGPHAERVAGMVAEGRHVVSTSGALADVRDLVELEDTAARAGVTVVVGAAVSPGLSGLLARVLVEDLDTCDELHVAVHGTSGPSCAREHHDTLSGWACGWDEGEWIERTPAGSGRELCWFPEPVGARDCYRGEMPDPLLLHRAFPEVTRISARVSATRRDRLTARLPMLSPPHREGGIGALRVEARGADATGARDTRILGIAELIGTASAAVATSFADLVDAGSTRAGVVTAADDGLPTKQLLRAVVRRGVRLQRFTGIPTP